MQKEGVERFPTIETSLIEIFISSLSLRVHKILLWEANTFQPEATLTSFPDKLSAYLLISSDYTAETHQDIVQALTANTKRWSSLQPEGSFHSLFLKWLSQLLLLRTMKAWRGGGGVHDSTQCGCGMEVRQMWWLRLLSETRTRCRDSTKEAIFFPELWWTGCLRVTSISPSWRFPSPSWFHRLAQAITSVHIRFSKCLQNSWECHSVCPSHFEVENRYSKSTVCTYCQG